jgi:translation initiation factor IF-2
MAETAVTKRLKAVAVEFNVSTSTVVEYLSSRNFDVEDKPTAKISEDAYEELLKKFAPDKLDRERVEKRELTPLITRGGAERAAQAAGAATQAKTTPAPAAAPPKEEPKAAETPAPVQEEPKPAAKPEPVAAVVAEEVPAEPKPEKAPAKKEEAKSALKVVGKIDLEDLKPKKKGGKKKAEEPVAEAPAEAAEPAAEEKKPAKKGKAKEETAEVLADAETISTPLEPEIIERTAELLTGERPLIEKETQIDDLKGLTVVGKIDLDQFKRKKPLVSTDNPDTLKKRRRLRPIGGETPAQPDPRDQRPGGDNRGPGGPNRGPGGGDNRGGFTRVGRDQIQNRPGGPGAPGAPSTGTPAEMDEKRIQEQIKNTLNRLTKRPHFADTKRNIKRRKKADRRERQEAEDAVVQGNTIQVTEFITANEFANLMNVPVTQVITACLSLGLMISINQRLDAETITIVADEFGYEVEFREAEMDEPAMEQPDNEKAMKQRAPIVTIMGHVDHGKTSLLDYIRNTNVVAGEAGGITQHIGAYEVKLENGKKITFLDTPGHEAFTAMRARGAKVTDIAIIVIAADDQVMPQTREAISHAQAANVPIVFAFNKIDKEGANTERIRQQLAELNVLVEEWGGKFQTQEIAAKKGLNVELLLEKVLLEAELLDLKADASKRAVGTVIEASLDKGKGIVATVVVEKGTLRVGDPLLAGANSGKVKAMFNERGEKMKEAGPATPVQLLGFEGAPTAGDKFYVTESDSVSRDMANKRRQLLREQGIRTRKHITLDEIGRRLAIGNFRELNLIIKGDVDGSVEALSDSLQRLSTDEVQVNVIFKGVGQISESDVLLASASDAIIIGFQVRPSMSARKLAENEQIDIRLYSVIYDTIEEVKAAMEGLLAPTHEEKITSNVEIREVFRISKVGAVAGCYVLDGKITRGSKVRIIRDGVVVFTGELDTLKRFKDDVKEVASGYECGLTIKNFNDIKEGDIVEGFEDIEVARKL